MFASHVNLWSLELWSCRRQANAELELELDLELELQLELELELDLQLELDLELELELELEQEAKLELPVFAKKRPLANKRSLNVPLQPQIQCWMEAMGWSAMAVQKKKPQTVRQPTCICPTLIMGF